MHHRSVVVFCDFLSFWIPGQNEIFLGQKFSGLMVSQQLEPCFLAQFGGECHRE